MKIENNLTAISNTLFRYKNNYKYLTNKQKEDNFFIIRRYLSKIEYFKLMQYINYKDIDPVVGMDIIFSYFLNKEYPNGIWNKSSFKKESVKYSKDEILLMNKLEVSYDELMLLQKYFKEDLENELKYYKMLEKDIKK